MKINDYKVEMNDNHNYDVIAIRNTERIKVGEINYGFNAEQVDELARTMLAQNNMQLVSVQETIVEREDLVDRKADLALVRNEMRKIMKELGNKNVPLEQKKAMLGVYGTLCNAATIVTKACIVELAYDKMGKEL